MAEGIDLKEYVSETLRAIAEGVRAAQSDPVVGAHIGRAPLNTLEPFTDDYQGNTVMAVKFDVATTVEARASGGGGVSVRVLSVAGIEGNAKREGGTSAVSRVSFAVPMAIPKPSAQHEEDAASRRRSSL